MFVAIIFALIIIGSIIFHFWSPWWWTPVASNWGNIDDTIILTFWVTGAVFVAVCLFMAYCVWAYRYRPDRKAEYKPEDKKLEFRLTWFTALGVVALLAPGLVVWNKYITVPENAFKIEVVAYQWGWNYRLPGDDGILGKTSVGLINDDNPYGLDSNDPNSKDDILVMDADLHLKINQPVKIELRSLDVLHNFYIPQFRAKMDTLPGIITYYWFTPEKKGEYEILCAEYCGTGHYAMRGFVKVDEEKDYSNWLAKQISFEKMLAKNKLEKNLLIAEKKRRKKMNDEYIDNKIETKAADSSSGSYAPPAEKIPAKEAPDQELYHAKSFWTKWVFCQDAKVIGIQYALTATAIGMIGLILSWGMRLQLGFPETFSFLGPATYYQSVTMHGMIMVIYLLTALFLGGFGNYLIPLMVGARDMVFPYVNMVSYWMFLVAVLVLIASFLYLEDQQEQVGLYILLKQYYQEHQDLKWE